MKLARILLVSSLIVMLEGALSAAPPLKVLCIGNSQMGSSDVPQMLNVLSESAPADCPRIEADRAFTWGTGLKGYWDLGEKPGSARAMIPSKKWDYVIVQEMYDAEEGEFRDYVARFDKEIKKAGSKTILFATAGPSKFRSPANYDPRGFERLNDMHIAMGKEMGLPVAAAGYAWRKYWGPNPSDEEILDLYHEDKGHPGVKGTYIYACLLYAVLTGKSPEGLTSEFKGIRGGVKIPKEQAAKMQKAAWQQYQECLTAR